MKNTRRQSISKHDSTHISKKNLLDAVLKTKHRSTWIEARRQCGGDHSGWRRQRPQWPNSEYIPGIDNGFSNEFYWGYERDKKGKMTPRFLSWVSGRTQLSSTERWQIAEVWGSRWVMSGMVLDVQMELAGRNNNSGNSNHSCTIKQALLGVHFSGGVVA